MKTSLFAAVAAFHSFASAASGLTARHVQHERRDVESSMWVKREVVDADFNLPMRIGLAQGNLHKGHDLLMEVSDPQSTRYGQYYTVEEVHDLFAPSGEAVSEVLAWLEASGIASHRVSQSANKQWLQFDAHTAEAEELLKTKYHVYEHAYNGKSTVGCDEYHVHEDIQHHVDYITPGIKGLDLRYSLSGGIEKRGNKKNVTGPRVKKPLPLPLAEVVQAQANKSTKYCGEVITPDCIKVMYDISVPTSSVKGNELGIFEDEAQFLDQKDMNLFYSNLATRIPQGTFPAVKGIDGAVNINKPHFAGDEAALDFQISYPLIYPQQSVLFTTDDDVYQEDYKFDGFFNNFLDAIDGSYCTYSAFGETGNSKIDPVYPDPKKGGYKGQLQCGVYKPTNVISLSYELAEFNTGESANYQKRQCNEYMKLGMQGISIVFASGDYGVGSAFGCAGKKGKIFNPNFPSNCPYVTSLGATTLPEHHSASSDNETAVTQFPSGGGFSNTFPRPSYQDAAVKGYFASPEAPTFPYYTGPNMGNGIYNRSGRGIPDISAVGQNIVIFSNGEPILVGGTSASTPLFAAILTRINEERLNAGKKTVGFVNPVLYKNPSAFKDVTVGSNPNCGTPGFKAAPGWDPLTGLGTPNYPALLKVFMALP